MGGPQNPKTPKPQNPTDMKMCAVGRPYEL